MNDLQIFSSSEFGEIRTALIDGEPWFVGKDVAVSLGYSNSRDAVIRHVDEDDRRVSRITTPSGEQKMTIINESGLYSLILSSKLPAARGFKRWVTSEVLPALRKTGLYSIQGETPETENNGLCFEDYMRAASITSKCTKDHLPLVMYFLEKAGFDIPDVLKEQRRITKSSKEKTDPHSLPREDVSVAEAQDALSRLRQKGLTFSEMEAVVGMNRVLLSYYLNGQRTPKPGRYAYIVEVINQFLDADVNS